MVSFETDPKISENFPTLPQVSSISISVFAITSLLFKNLGPDLLGSWCVFSTGLDFSGTSHVFWSMSIVANR